MVWFNPSTLEAETEFMLVGLVLGLAIYNSVLLDFPLPIALYKKLVGQPLSLRDLSEMEPTLGKSLRELLNYSGAHKLYDPLKVWGLEPIPNNQAILYALLKGSCVAH